jgi:hypothetical protein
MRRIAYNLASGRKIDRRAFSLTVGVLLLALVVFNAATVFNLSRLRRPDRVGGLETGSLSQKMAAIEQVGLERQKQIAAWQKTWNRQLALANALIARKCFSFVARLDFVEKVCGPGMSVRHLSIANEASGKVSMAVSALAQNQLMGLYKKLLPYKLVIANENQAEESYQANLSFRMEDEKK